MKNILITGGSGLVGKQLTRILEENKSEVSWIGRSKKKDLIIKNTIGMLKMGALKLDGFKIQIPLFIWRVQGCGPQMVGFIQKRNI